MPNLCHEGAISLVCKGISYAFSAQSHAKIDLAARIFHLYLPNTALVLLASTDTETYTKEDTDMAAFDTTRTTYGSVGLFGRIGSRFNTVLAAAVAWNDARVTRNALEALSDRELADIGMCRGDIDDIANGKSRF